MYYSNEIIEDIRIQNNIVQVISEYVQLKKKGSEYTGLCPFHNEKTPSFSVSEVKQVYHCFGCGAGGNVFTFIMQIENYSFIEAVKHLADRVHIILPEPVMSDEDKKRLEFRKQLIDINKESAKYFYYQLYSTRGKYALQYLIQRKVKKNIRKKFGLGYSNINRNDLFQYLVNKGYNEKAIRDLGLVNFHNNQLYDKFWNRLMFPIFDVHNKVIGFGGRLLGDGHPKYLNSPESILYNKRKHLYGLNIARTTSRQQAFVVEGYMDVISLHQAGFDNAVASLGTALTTEQAILLKRYFSDVVVIYDSDEAGIKAALRAIPILHNAGLNVKVIRIPQYKDPDEFIKNKGKEEFDKLVNTAQTGMMFEANILKNRYSMNKPDEKIKFIMSVARKLVEIENKVEQDVYIKQIADETHISEKSIKQEMLKIIQHTGIITNNEPIVNNKKVDKVNESVTAKAQKNLLAVLMNHPSIFQTLKQYITPEDFTDENYKKAAEYVYECLQKNTRPILASVINLFSDIEKQNKIATIDEANCEFDSVLQEEKAINELVKIIKQSKIDYLSRNNSDLTELQNLIKTKRELQNLNISLKMT